MSQEVNLTEGAIAMLASGQHQGGIEFKPILQMTDIRLVTPQNQINNNNNPGNERYRFHLSDGVYSQQGMLATQRNDLIRLQKLQNGSIVQLNQFVCNLIKNRMIIIIMDLDVILERCDRIGDPKLFPSMTDNAASPVANSPAPVSPMNQTGHLYGSAQQFGAVSVPNAKFAGGYQAQPPVMDIRNTGSLPSYNSFSGSHDSSHYTAPVYHRPENGMGVARPPLNYLQSPQPSYQQPPRHSYNQPPRQSYQESPPMFMNRGPIAKNEAPPKFTPIASLNFYQGRWTIKARVTSKGDLRRYNNNKGEGKVFSFDLIDAGRGQIRATCFNAVADQFYDMIETGKVYMISKGTLKDAQKNFNPLPNDHEITLDSNSIVQPCYEDDRSIPYQDIQFCPISDIERMEKDSFVNVIGMVSSIGPSSTIMRKNGIETQKRILHIKDMSGRSTELTLWGNYATAEGQTLQHMCDSGASPVVAVKSGRVNEYNGKSITTLATTQLSIEPDFPEAHNLRAWFDTEGKNIPFVSLTRETMGIARTDQRKTIAQIKDERLGTSEKPDWITVCATVKFVKGDGVCYPACPLKIGDRQCNKKAIDVGDGTWKCGRCDQTFSECDYRYMLQFQIQDHTGDTWVTAFQECGEEIMGLPAKECYLIKYDKQDDDKFSEVMRTVLLTKFIFKLKVHGETYLEEYRVKSTVVKAERLNFATETKYLLDVMNKMKTGDAGSVHSKTEHVTPSTGLYGSGFGIGSNQPPTSIQNYGNQGAIYGSQYGGSRAISTNPSGMYMNCNNCGGMGHNSMNCPRVNNMQGQQPYGGGFANANRPAVGMNAGNVSTECYKCHQIGHWARDCPGLTNYAPANGSANVTYGMYGGDPKQRFRGF